MFGTQISQKLRRWTRSGSGKAALPVAAALSAMMACAAVAGCQKHEAYNGASFPIEPTSSPSMVSGSDVVATVNGDPITAGELYDALQHYVPSRVSNYPNNPDLSQPSGRAALKNLIISTVAIQFAQAQGVPVTADELKSSLSDQALLQGAKLTMPFDSILQGQGYTEDSYKQEVLAPQVAQFNVMEKAENITPADVQAQYAASQSQYTIPPRVHIHRIVCATQQDAENVYAGIKGGRKMSDYAGVSLAQPDEGGNPADTTDLARWLDSSLTTAFGPKFSAQLFKAKPGDLLPPASVQGRWWVVQVVDNEPRQPLPLNQVSNLVKLNLLRAKSGSTAQDLQEQLIQALHSATIKINLPEYQSVAMEVHMAGIANPAQPAVGAHGKK